jgi:hypothetical protein
MEEIGRSKDTLVSSQGIHKYIYKDTLYPRQEKKMRILQDYMYSR